MSKTIDKGLNYLQVALISIW